jgi:glutamine synthetase
MSNLRRPCDELEKLVDKKMRPFPTYEDLMFDI